MTTSPQKIVDHGKEMAADLVDITSRERAAAEMKASFLRALTADQLADALAEALLQLTAPQGVTR